MQQIRLLLICLCFLMGNSVFAIEKVVLQLKWKHQFQFAGYYAAIENGYYREKGLDVTLLEAEESIDPIQTVLTEKAQYGIGTSDLLLARMNGAEITVLATIFQHSPLAIMVRSDSKIETVQDLLSKKIMIEPQSAEIFAYFKNEGIDPKKMQILHHSFDTKALINKEVDAMSAYVVDEPFHLQEAQIPVTFFYPRTGGVDFFGDSLFTTQKEIKKHPERVQAFIDASLKGWNYAFAHPEEITDIILEKYSKRHSRKHLLYEAKKMKELIRPDLLEVGYVNPGRWKHIAEVYSELGMIQKIPDEDLWSSFLYQPHNSKASRVFVIIIMTLASALGVLLLFFLPIYYMNKKLRKEIIEKEKIQKMLEENEKKFRFMVKNSYDVISIIDKNANSIYVSDSIERITGFKAEDLIGKNSFQYVHSDDFAGLQHALLQILSLPNKNLLIEYRHKRSDGQWVNLEAAGTNLLHDPAIKGIVFNIRDATERKQMEAEKDRIQSQLIHTEKLASIGTLAAGMAHEINNPLAIISGYLEIMGNDVSSSDSNHYNSEKMKKYIGKQKEAVKRIANIVNGLRLSVRPDNSDTIQVDFHRLVTETLSIIESAYLKAGIRLELELNSKQPYVQGNYGKFQQVLMNLLFNAKDAVKDTPHALVKIETKDSNEQFIFEVHDNGCGIKEENLKKVFIPFYTNKDPDKGTGFGLYIVHTIIQSAKGSIEVQSEEGQKTTFRITLPKDIRLPISTNFKSDSPLALQIQGRALVVEDEEEIRLLLKKMLEGFGLDVELSSNGLEGLQELKKSEFDFVLTDMTMPEMNGELFLAEAKKLELKNTKFYVITGNICIDQEIILDDSLKNFVHAYIQKPFSYKEIREALTKI